MGESSRKAADFAGQEPGEDPFAGDPDAVGAFLIPSRESSAPFPQGVGGERVTVHIRERIDALRRRQVRLRELAMNPFRRDSSGNFPFRETGSSEEPVPNPVNPDYKLDI